MSFNQLQGNSDDKLSYIQCFSSDNKTSFLNDQMEELPSTSINKTQYDFQDEAFQ